MKRFIEIVNINLTTIGTDEPEVNVPCESCTLCCSVLSPYLTPDEISSGLYPFSLVTPSEDQIKENKDAGPTVVLFRKKDGGCGMFIDGKCSIYEIRPKACRQFDCRKGHHPKIPNMVKEG